MFSAFSNPVTKLMSYADFLSGVIELKGEVTEDLIQKAFKGIGVGNTGNYITKQ